MPEFKLQSVRDMLACLAETCKEFTEIDNKTDAYINAWLRLNEENTRLRSAIAEHRGQKADDRCIEDDDRLYEALQDGIKCDRRVGSKEDMLAHCARFIERRCEGGGHLSYFELERQKEHWMTRALRAEADLEESALAASDLLPELDRLLRVLKERSIDDKPATDE